MEIPKTPLETSVTSHGFFPDVALHKHGSLQVQEPSYSMIVSAVFLLIVAAACCFIPWEERTLLGNGPKVIYFIAGGIAWGGICIVIGYFILKKLRQEVVVDLQQGMCTVQGIRGSKMISTDDVIGIQICRGERYSFQANLVYFQSDSEEPARHCLYSSSVKAFCVRLARSYQSGCGFEIIDQT